MRKIISQRNFLVIISIFIILILMALIIVGYSATWTGFGDRTLANGDILQPSKTLWDWMELILIPIILFLVAFYFNETNRRSDQSRTELQLKVENDRSNNAEQHQILQTYLDRMQDLILDKGLLESDETMPISRFARTLTLTTLSRLNPNRKSTILTFLDEMKLIQRYKGKLIISLSGADLECVGFPYGIFRVNLHGADLSGADLQEAKLDYPNFRNANLAMAVLERGSFIGGDFRGADLNTALLEGANFYEAIFDNSTILPNGKVWNNTPISDFGAILKAPYTEEELEEAAKELKLNKYK